MGVDGQYIILLLHRMRCTESSSFVKKCSCAIGSSAQNWQSANSRHAREEGGIGLEELPKRNAMQYLILTDEKKPNETRLQEELRLRGHDVTLLDLNDLEKTAGTYPSANPNLLKQLFNREAYRIEHLLVPAFISYIHGHAYDAILPTRVIAAQVVSSVLQAEENFHSFTAFIFTEGDALSRKVELNCDEYLTMTESAIRTMLNWGLPAERIHYVKVSNQTIPALCNEIEPLVYQWRENVQKLIAAQ